MAFSIGSSVLPGFPNSRSTPKCSNTRKAASLTVGMDKVPKRSGEPSASLYRLSPVACPLENLLLVAVDAEQDDEQNHDDRRSDHVYRNDGLAEVTRLVADDADEIRAHSEAEQRGDDDEQRTGHPPHARQHGVVEQR